MKKTCLFSIALLLSVIATAQYKNVYKANLEWYKVYDYNKLDDRILTSNCLTIDDSSNIYLTGGSTSDSFGDLNWIVSRYNPDGNLKWLKFDTFVNKLTRVRSLGYAIVWDSVKKRLFTCGFETGDAGGIGFTSEFDLRMFEPGGKDDGLYFYVSPAVEDASGLNMCVGHDGTVYTTGYVYRQSPKRNEIATMTITDLTKNPLQFDVSDSNETKGQFIVNDKDGNVYVSGLSNDSKNTSLLCRKYDKTGKIAWTSTFQNADATNLSSCTGLAVDNNGNAYIAGTVPKKNGSLEGIIIKYDSKGKQVSQQGFSGLLTGTRNAACNSITIDKNGNLFAAGYNETNDGTFASLLKMDASGNVVWFDTLQKPVDGTLYSQAVAITVDDTGNAYVSGTNDRNIYAARYNTKGERQWYTRMDDNTITNNEPVSIKLDKKGNVVIAAAHDGDSVTNKDIMVVKYSQSMSKVIDHSGINGNTLTKQNFKIYPNPFSEHLKFDLSLTNHATVEISVYDVMGKEQRVKTWPQLSPGMQHLDMELSDMPAGLYFYNISINGTEVANGKTVKY